MSLTNQQYLDTLLTERDKILQQGDIYKSGWQTKDGDAIQLRRLQEVEDLINLYNDKVAADAGKQGRWARVNLYG